MSCLVACRRVSCLILLTAEPTDLFVQLSTALLECAVLNVVLQIVCEVLQFTLEQLQLVLEVVELGLILRYDLLFHIHLLRDSLNLHSSPEIAVVDEVVHSFNPEEEPKNSIVGRQG